MIEEVRAEVRAEATKLLPATSEGRLEAEVNVFLAVQTHNEGRNIHDLT